LTFQEDKPTIEKNPLSGHADPSKNAIKSETGRGLVSRVEEIRRPLKDVFAMVC